MNTALRLKLIDYHRGIRYSAGFQRRMLHRFRMALLGKGHRVGIVDEDAGCGHIKERYLKELAICLVPR